MNNISSDCSHILPKYFSLLLFALDIKLFLYFWVNMNLQESLFKMNIIF